MRFFKAIYNMFLFFIFYYFAFGCFVLFVIGLCFLTPALVAEFNAFLGPNLAQISFLLFAAAYFVFFCVMSALVKCLLSLIYYYLTPKLLKLRLIAFYRFIDNIFINVGVNEWKATKLNTHLFVLPFLFYLFLFMYLFNRMIS